MEGRKPEVTESESRDESIIMALFENSALSGFWCEKQNQCFSIRIILWNLKPSDRNCDGKNQACTFGI